MNQILQMTLILVLLSGWPSTSPAADDVPSLDVAVAEADSAAAEEETPEPEPEPIPRLVQRASEIIGQLTDLRKRVEMLREEAKGETDEDLEVLNRQMAEAKLRFLKGIGELVQNLQAQEKSGLPGTEAREVLEFNLSRLGTSIVEHLDAGRKKLSGLRKRRADTNLAQLPALEQEIAREVAWLGSLYAAYAAQVQQMAVVGLDNDELARDLANRLANRADRLLGRVQLVDEQLIQLKTRLEQTPGDETLVPETQLVRDRKRTLTDALGNIVDLMDESELDSTQYRQFLIRTTGNVTVDVFRTRVMTSLIDEWTQDLRRQLRESGPAFFAEIIVFLLILGVFKLLATLSRRLAQGAMRRSTANISQLQRSMLLSLASRGIMAIGIMVGLSQLGVELGPLLAGLGIAGFIVGFALQDSLANFASGVMILAYRPYDVDDFIEAGGVRGNVSYMSLVSTTIITFDNQTLIVPNSKIWGDVITNITNQDRRRIDMTFHIAYDDDLEQAEQLLASVCIDHPRVLSEPKPLIKVHKLGKSSIEFAVRPWVMTKDYWETYWDITREVRLRFLADGFAPPLPQREVRIRPAAVSSQGSDTGKAPDDR